MENVLICLDILRYIRLGCLEDTYIWYLKRKKIKKERKILCTAKKGCEALKKAEYATKKKLYVIIYINFNLSHLVCALLVDSSPPLNLSKVMLLIGHVTIRRH